MVRVQPVVLPRIVSQDDLRLQHSNHPSDLAAQHKTIGQLAVDLAEKDDVAGAVT